MIPEPYVDVAFMDSFHLSPSRASRSSLWLSWPAADKEESRWVASDFFDWFLEGHVRGWKIREDQGRLFPRHGIINANGWNVAEVLANPTPDDVKYAVSILAYEWMRGGKEPLIPTSEVSTTGSGAIILERKKIGVLEQETRYSSKSASTGQNSTFKIYPEAMSYVTKYIHTDTNSVWSG